MARTVFVTCSICLVIGAVVHGVTLAGRVLPGSDAISLVMLLCVLALALPISRLSTHVSRAQGRRTSWEAALVGCPRWMRFAVLGLFAYTFLGYATMWFQPTAHVSGISVSALRVFSSFWMLFFAVGLAIAVSHSRYMASASHTPSQA